MSSLSKITVGSRLLPNSNSRSCPLPPTPTLHSPCQNVRGFAVIKWFILLISKNKDAELKTKYTNRSCHTAGSIIRWITASYCPGMEKAVAPHSSTLAWKIPWTEEAWWAAVHGVVKSWTRLRDFTLTCHFHALEKEMATHSSILA